MDLRHSLTMNASMLLRLYIWSRLRMYMGSTWKPLPGGAPPIIPVQEQPEIQESGNPYMIYIYDTNATSDLFQLQSETLTLRMFSQSPAIIAATGKLVYRVCSRYEESANDINRWIQGNDGTDTLKAQFGSDQRWLDEARNIYFKRITVGGIQGAQPAQEEGGRIDSIITIDMEYVELNNWASSPTLGLTSNNG